MYRLLRVAGSFVIVLVAYCAYALVAVPLIEPSADPNEVQAISEAERAAAQRRIDAGIGELHGLFPPGIWELKSPKILESEQIKLLMQDYRNLGDGRVEIRPCTMIFTPDGPADNGDQRKRRAVILEAPDGALLEFDGPFDLRQMKVGRLVGGQLLGRITIRSAGKSPGPEDDLLIVTRDVQLTEKNIFTPHMVDFRYGPHYGRGRQMRIKLLAAGQTPRADPRKPSVAGIELFELRRLERLHLELDESELASDRTPPAAEPPATAVPDDLPVEITCQGPFRFDAIRKVATFEDRVDVLRINPTGQSDQLNCELLSVFFTDRNAPEPQGPDDAAAVSEKRTDRSLNLKPQRIVAQGNPVVVVVPSRQAQGRTQRLEYDLETRRIVADGRGWLRGQMDQRPDEQIEAHWNERLHLREEEENQVISLTGGARLQLRGIGRLDAGEIHFWLLESEPQRAEAKSRLRPDRMLARDQVRIDWPKLSGGVEQLEVWFEPAMEGGRGKGEGGRRKAEGGRGKASFGDRRDSDLMPVVEGGGQPESQPTARQQHFQVSGRLLRARVLLREDKEDKQTELSELVIEDDVQLVETQTEKPDERPLLVRGDRLHVVDAQKPYAAVTVTGRPAHFQGRGLGLTGPNINLNRGTNRLWVDAAGRMDLVMDRDLEGRPLRDPGLLRIHWQDDMVFDGRTARFEESVTVTAPHRHLETETLEVQFKRAINFSDEKLQQEDPDIERLLCRGGVFMESISFDRQDPKKQISHEQMQVPDLAINPDSGALTAGGPGWLTSVTRGSDDPLAADGGILGRGPDRRGTVAESSRTHADDEEQLRGLHIRFQGSIAGNVLEGQQEMTFRDRVKAAYAPVDSWAATLDVNDPDALDPDGVLMKCDRLLVNQMATPDGKGHTMELAADGNVVVEGSRSTFIARAARMTYAEAKDLLILEGDGRSDAELFHQPRLGGPTSQNAARKIFYWPRTRQLRVQGARSLQFDRLPARSPATP